MKLYRNALKNWEKVILFFLFLSQLFLFRGVHGEQPHVHEAFRLLAEESVLLSNKLNMQIIGCGGIFNDSIESLEIVYRVPGRMDITNARLVFIAIIQEWLKRLNSDMQARVFYKNFPMTIDNLELRMMLSEYDERSTKKNAKIALMFNLGKRIVYCYRDKNGTICPFLRENYCDAVKEIEKQIKIKK